MNYSKPSTKLLIAGCLSLVVAFASLNRANANTDPSKNKKKEINSSTTHIYFDIDEKSPDAPSQVQALPLACLTTASTSTVLYLITNH